MTNDDDMLIRQTAREICAAQVDDDEAATYYRQGRWDYHDWMRLVEQGIRKGIEIGRSL